MGQVIIWWKNSDAQFTREESIIINFLRIISMCHATQLSLFIRTNKQMRQTNWERCDIHVLHNNDDGKQSLWHGREELCYCRELEVILCVCVEVLIEVFSCNLKRKKCLINIPRWSNYYPRETLTFKFFCLLTISIDSKKKD